MLYFLPPKTEYGVISIQKRAQADFSFKHSKVIPITKEEFDEVKNTYNNLHKLLPNTLSNI